MSLRLLFLATGVVLVAVPALAESTTIALINAVGEDASALEARKTGTANWSALPYSARSGASGPVTFDTQDCAWDFRLKLASGAVVNYGNVNVCEVKLVTLHRRNGTVWVDYD
ncbi:hypothetical protein G7076_02370 [Sphingomonas sp. HDW15A]|uniref:hypothetical protein n=1 Tax=Sphingomonas sp. HDW15A TaxID=2714942 RepID=UPI00140B87A4|nr:hypothetical protein [Sphingomonas sp. HDW15A]QIK95484.1 hypothetical protein G7076_02370 [Sphingomonas sp. HDW15A]